MEQRATLNNCLRKRVLYLRSINSQFQLYQIVLHKVGELNNTAMIMEIKKQKIIMIKSQKDSFWNAVQDNIYQVPKIESPSLSQAKKHKIKKSKNLLTTVDSGPKNRKIEPNQREKFLKTESSVKETQLITINPWLNSKQISMNPDKIPTMEKKKKQPKGVSHLKFHILIFLVRAPQFHRKIPSLPIILERRTSRIWEIKVQVKRKMCLMTVVLLTKTNMKINRIRKHIKVRGRIISWTTKYRRHKMTKSSTHTNLIKNLICFHVKKSSKLFKVCF